MGDLIAKIKISNIKYRATNSQELNNIKIAHNVIDYHSFDIIKSVNDTNHVKLHFGLQGSYDFSFV